MRAGMRIGRCGCARGCTEAVHNSTVEKRIGLKALAGAALSCGLNWKHFNRFRFFSILLSSEIGNLRNCLRHPCGHVTVLFLEGNVFSFLLIIYEVSLICICYWFHYIYLVCFTLIEFINNALGKYKYISSI